MRIEDVPHCPLCGHENRRVLYTGLRDRLYGVPGEWTLKECRRCGLVFLDPRPTPEDIGKAYTSYYTHSATMPPDNFVRRVRRYVRGGYLATKFGYAAGVGRLQRLAGWLAYLHPEQREVIKGSVIYLPAQYRGRLLEVGFGSGETLAELLFLGWEVEGVDFDAQAVETARRRHNLSVRVGTLEDQDYEPESFDVITMSHVIEHVHEPMNLLRECRRLLKSGGVLVVATPNVNSIGHQQFKSAWRGLEPPRHLSLFSRKTLTQAANDSGLSCAELRTTVRSAYKISIESNQLRTAGPVLLGNPPVSTLEKFRGHMYQYALAIVLRLRPDAGEELLMLAVKDG